MYALIYCSSTMNAKRRNIALPPIKFDPLSGAIWFTNVFGKIFSEISNLTTSAHNHYEYLTHWNPSEDDTRLFDIERSLHELRNEYDNVIRLLHDQLDYAVKSCGELYVAKMEEPRIAHDGAVEGAAIYADLRQLIDREWLNTEDFHKTFATILRRCEVYGGSFLTVYEDCDTIIDQWTDTCCAEVERIIHETNNCKVAIDTLMHHRSVYVQTSILQLVQCRDDLTVNDLRWIRVCPTYTDYSTRYEVSAPLVLPILRALNSSSQYNKVR
jgi:hypothetical protein